jgi:hypothetical protein
MSLSRTYAPAKGLVDHTMTIFYTAYLEKYWLVKALWIRYTAVADLEGAQASFFSRNLLSNVCKTQDLRPKICDFFFFAFSGGGGGGAFWSAPPLWNFWIRHCTDCFGYPVADLEEVLAISFFDIKFFDIVGTHGFSFRYTSIQW